MFQHEKSIFLLLLLLVVVLITVLVLAAGLGTPLLVGQDLVAVTFYYSLPIAEIVHSWSS